MMLILSQVTGERLVRQLLVVLAIGICCGIIWWLGHWVLGKLGGPPLVGTIWDGLFIFLAALVAINFLLGMIGHPLIVW